MEIRPFEGRDWPAVWEIIAPVFKAGETYAIPRDITEEAAHALWVEHPTQTFVATENTKTLGTYYIKPNQQGPGAHVCNCGYITARTAQRRGVASQLCGHSLHLAPQFGFSAMQYNLVLENNQGAVRLWQRHGFEIIGTLPGVFEHPTLGRIGAHIMYRAL